jgi:hypothetical protein
VTVFFINAESQNRLRDAAAHARRRPIRWEKLKAGALPEGRDKFDISLGDREHLPDVEREVYEVILPLGWRVCIGCEEQPAGIALHVSMSSPADGKVPSPEAMFMLCDALGHKQEDIARLWMEEYEPNRRAINMLIVLEERQVAGHA